MLSIPGMRQRTGTTEANDLGNQAALPAESSARWASTVVRRTFRVTERRQDRPTSTLDPNAASVHPVGSRRRRILGLRSAIPRSPCSWQRPSRAKSTTDRTDFTDASDSCHPCHPWSNPFGWGRRPHRSTRSSAPYANVVATAPTSGPTSVVEAHQS
jgi:hypothetical protein